MRSRAMLWLAFGGVSVACAAGAFETPAPRRLRTTVESTDGETQVAGTLFRADTIKALPGVDVWLHCECLKGTARTVTDAQGRFEFADLPPGDYEVDFVHLGRHTRTSVQTLTEGQRLQVNALLPAAYPPRTIT